jgi:hypothetical protein
MIVVESAVRVWIDHLPPAFREYDKSLRNSNCGGAEIRQHI